MIGRVAAGSPRGGEVRSERVAQAPEFTLAQLVPLLAEKAVEDERYLARLGMVLEDVPALAILYRRMVEVRQAAEEPRASRTWGSRSGRLAVSQPGSRAGGEGLAWGTGRRRGLAGRRAAG